MNDKLSEKTDELIGLLEETSNNLTALQEDLEKLKNLAGAGE